MEEIAASNGMEDVMVISLDIVINEEWGNIGREEVQKFWLAAILDGKVIGLLSGPPCCTWSAARGKVDPCLPSAKQKGPRIIRTRAELWGMHSVSIKEMLQLHDMDMFFLALAFWR